MLKCNQSVLKTKRRPLTKLTLLLRHRTRLGPDMPGIICIRADLDCRFCIQFVKQRTGSLQGCEHTIENKEGDIGFFSF